MSDPASPPRCSTKNCENLVIHSLARRYRTCEDCRNREREKKARQMEKRRREAETEATSEPTSKRQRQDPLADADEHEGGEEFHWQSLEDFLSRLRETRTDQQGKFQIAGYFPIPSDGAWEGTNLRQCEQLIAGLIWDATGYRFLVHDRPKTGSDDVHKCRRRCCQDKHSEQKSRKKVGANVKNRDTVGMDRFDCNSGLTIICRSAEPDHPRVARVSIKHNFTHISYFDVEVPEEVIETIRAEVENLTPSQLVEKIRKEFVNVTPAQIYFRWSELSRAIWKRADEQLPSAKQLLHEYTDDVDVFDLPEFDSIEQLAWGLKGINAILAGQIVEVGIDATFGTNAKHLELYAMVGEHDDAGFPLSYCLLSTASAVDPGKRLKALTAWAVAVRDKYNIDPKFVHTDKDMAEIGMSRTVWPDAKHQLCWWHIGKALEKRLGQNKLSTSPYHVTRACDEFSFINPRFLPYGRPDPADGDGQIPGGEAINNILASSHSDPNRLTLRVPASSAIFGGPSGEKSFIEEEEEEEDRLIIRIPGRPQAHPPRHEFCPEQHRDHVTDMIDRHLNAHPLIPGYSAPTAEGVRFWAVKEVYTFCCEKTLPNLWVYLWENWYRPGRWELWARSSATLIPLLRTTMFVEAHWSRMKRDFLHHFNQPRLDLLVWILTKKLVPTYIRKLDRLFTYTGRHRELNDWRKDFKSDWRAAEKRLIPDEDQVLHRYRPNTHDFTCTCPAFACSRFLICKHIVQAFQQIEAKTLFFVEAKRRRTIPFWSHPALIPVDKSAKPPTIPPNDPDPAIVPMRSYNEEAAPSDGDDEFDPEEVSQGSNEEYRRLVCSDIKLFTNFLHQLEYQVQFNDHRYLKEYQKASSTFRKHAQACINRTTRTTMPATWAPSNSKSMYFRPRKE